MSLPFIKGTDRTYYDQTGNILLYTKVVGVTFDGRQDIIAKMPPMATVILVWDRNNAYDKNAVGVYYQNQNIGYLNKDLAKTLCPFVKKCEQEVIAEKTGGKDGDNYGVNLTIRLYDDQYKSEKNKPKSPYKWILAIMIIFFFANYSVYIEGEKTFQSFIFKMVMEITWLILSLIICNFLKKKMKIGWNVVLSLFCGYIATIFLGICIIRIRSNQIQNSFENSQMSAIQSTLPNNAIFSLIKENNINSVTPKSTINVKKTSTPSSKEQMVETSTSIYKSIYIDGTRYICYPTPTRIPYPVPFISKSGYTEEQLLQYGHKKNDQGNFPGLYRAENGKYFFTGERKPLIHINDYGSYICNISNNEISYCTEATYQNADKNSKIYSNSTHNFFDDYSDYVLIESLSEEEQLQIEIDSRCRFVQ